MGINTNYYIYQSQMLSLENSTQTLPEELEKSEK